jgi:hypothetical protein
VIRDHSRRRVVRMAKPLVRRATVRTVEELRAQRPREVVIARYLAIAAAVLWMPIAGYLFSQPGLVGLVLIGYVFGAFGVVKGRQAGRIVVTVAVALAWILLLPYCWLGFSDEYLNGPGYAVMDILAVLLSLAGLVLSYQPACNRYVHLVTVARRGAAG